MTKQEIARELKAHGTTLTTSQIKKASKDDLTAMLEEAKKSNVVALPKKARLADRVIVEPTTDLSNVKPIREGTKRHAMVKALLKGCTLDELAEATGWSRNVASAAVYTDLKAAGLGVRREDGILTLILPKGSNVVPLRKPAAPAQKAANK